jgi:hypothetical protein
MSDLSPLPLVLTATDRLHRSALPGAPVVPARARRRRLRAASLEKE